MCKRLSPTKSCWNRVHGVNKAQSKQEDLSVHTAWKFVIDEIMNAPWQGTAGNYYSGTFWGGQLIGFESDLPISRIWNTHMIHPDFSTWLSRSQTFNFTMQVCPIITFENIIPEQCWVKFERRPKHSIFRLSRYAAEQNAYRWETSTKQRTIINK